MNGVSGGLFDGPTCPDCGASGYNAGHPGCPAFPVGGETMSKSTDPSTSHEAAASLRRTGRLGTLQRDALQLVRRHEGFIAHELDALQPIGHDSVRIARRLSELSRMGYIEARGSKVNPHTGKRALRWWAK